MKKQMVRMFTIMSAALLLSISVLELNADARAGGSRSLGSRGSRSYYRPSGTSFQPSRPRQQFAPAPAPIQQQAGGGFMRSMAGGLLGGMLGSMLFSGVAGAGGMGGGTGGGIGLFEIILLAGAGFLLYRYLKKRRGGGQYHPR